MIDACLFRPKELPGKSAVWEVTQKCYLKCPHCLSNAYNSKGGIDLDEAMKILDILELNGITEILYSGGEPLLWKPLFHILKSAKQRGIECCLSTTGFPEDSELIDKIIDLNIDSFHVSLDAWTPELHDKFRGEEGVFSATNKLVDKANKKGILVIVSVLIYKELLEHLEELFLLIQSMGITEVNFNFWIPVGRGKHEKENIVLDRDKGRIFELLVKKASQYNIHINSRRIEMTNHGLMKCHGGENVFFVDANGKSAVCSWAAKQWEDILDDITMNGIISSKSIQTFWEHSNDYLCKGCSRLADCGKGCPLFASFNNKVGDDLCINLQ